MTSGLALLFVKLAGIVPAYRGVSADEIRTFLKGQPYRQSPSRPELVNPLFSGSGLHYVRGRNNSEKSQTGALEYAGGYAAPSRDYPLSLSQANKGWIMHLNLPEAITKGDYRDWGTITRGSVPEMKPDYVKGIQKIIQPPSYSYKPEGDIEHILTPEPRLGKILNASRFAHLYKAMFGNRLPKI